jgi:hypothetical protein
VQGRVLPGARGSGLTIARPVTMPRHGVEMEHRVCDAAERTRMQRQPCLGDLSVATPRSMAMDSAAMAPAVTLMLRRPSKFKHFPKLSPSP